MRILITGTPGVGKTTLAEHFIHHHPEYLYINVSDFVCKYGLVKSYDNQFDSAVPDEERLLDELELLIQRNKDILIDHHSCERFPVRWFDIVVLLRLNTEDLYDRLAARNYSAAKIKENIEVEVMGVMEEAVADFDPDRVLTFNLRTKEDIQKAIVALNQRLCRIPRSVKLSKQSNIRLKRHKVKGIPKYYTWMWKGSLSAFYDTYQRAVSIYKLHTKI